MQLHDPWFLWLLVPLLFLFWRILRSRRHAAMRFSSLKLLSTVKPTLKQRLADLPLYLRLIALVLVVVALARPQEVLEDSRSEALGVDIVLTMDCSGSMLAQDFKLNGARKDRVTVVKDVVSDFIKARKGDRLGMVAFAARPYTVCPLTLDYPWLLANLNRVKVGDIEDGTAVGSAIMSGVSRLKNSKAKSRILILLTDGVNNAGKVAPLDAAKAAAAMGIKIYTIGVGTQGPVPYPVRGMLGNIVYQDVEIPLDEASLEAIASSAHGRYYRAQDTESLRRIYQEIDTLEKSKFDEQGFRQYQELFVNFLIAALGLLILEIVLANSWLRVVP